MLQAIQKNVAWRAIPIAAACAGVVFLLANMAITTIGMQISPALMLRYMASLVLGDVALTGENVLVIVVVGLLVHAVLSLVFTFVITLVIHRWGMVVGIVGGAVLGLCIYAINFYTMTLFFPWFFAMNGLAWAFSHMLFGAVAGGVYERLDTFDMPLDLPFGEVKS
jgi:hypothetical protein